MRKIRANSYEAQLTPDELHDLHTRLTAPGTSLLQVQQTAPPWRNGPSAGAKPCLATLSNISSRLRTETRLVDLQATEKMIQAIVKKLQANPKATPELVDQLAQLISYDCLSSFASSQGDTRDRIAEFKLLLKHQDQRLAKGKNRAELLDMLLRLETQKPDQGE